MALRICQLFPDSKIRTISVCVESRPRYTYYKNIYIITQGQYSPNKKGESAATFVIANVKQSPFLSWGIVQWDRHLAGHFQQTGETPVPPFIFSNDREPILAHNQINL